jgi:hypothetical protein
MAKTPSNPRTPKNVRGSGVDQSHTIRASPAAVTANVPAASSSAALRARRVPGSASAAQAGYFTPRVTAKYCGPGTGQPVIRVLWKAVIPYSSSCLSSTTVMVQACSPASGPLGASIVPRTCATIT